MSNLKASPRSAGWKQCSSAHQHSQSWREEAVGKQLLLLSSFLPGGELPGQVRQFWGNFLLLFCRQDAAKATYALIMIFTHMHLHQWANAIRHVSS